VEKKKKVKKKIGNIRKAERKLSREVTVKIDLERINAQKGIMVETLLDSGASVGNKFGVCKEAEVYIEKN